MSLRSAVDSPDEGALLGAIDTATRGVPKTLTWLADVALSETEGERTRVRAAYILSCVPWIVAEDVIASVLLEFVTGSNAELCRQGVLMFPPGIPCRPALVNPLARLAGGPPSAVAVRAAAILQNWGRLDARLLVDCIRLALSEGGDAADEALGSGLLEQVAANDPAAVAGALVGLLKDKSPCILPSGSGLSELVPVLERRYVALIAASGLDAKLRERLAEAWGAVAGDSETCDSELVGFCLLGSQATGLSVDVGLSGCWSHGARFAAVASLLLKEPCDDVCRARAFESHSDVYPPIRHLLRWWIRAQGRATAERVRASCRDERAQSAIDGWLSE